MKKLKKNQLKLDKEIISSLSENDLSVVKGGVENTKAPTICNYTNLNTEGLNCNTMKENCYATHNNQCVLITKADTCEILPVSVEAAGCQPPLVSAFTC